jgi:hypothetical protein
VKSDIVIAAVIFGEPAAYLREGQPGVYVSEAKYFDRGQIQLLHQEINSGLVIYRIPVRHASDVIENDIVGANSEPDSRRVIKGQCRACSLKVTQGLFLSEVRGVPRSPWKDWGS